MRLLQARSSTGTRIYPEGYIVRLKEHPILEFEVISYSDYMYLLKRLHLDVDYPWATSYIYIAREEELIHDNVIDYIDELQEFP